MMMKIEINYNKELQLSDWITVLMVELQLLNDLIAL